jgi:hypothetical protein
MADLNTAQLWGAVEPVVRKYYGLEAKGKKKAVYNQIFDESNGKEAVRHSMEFGGPGQLQLKNENSPVGSVQITQGPNKTWTYGVYAGQITMSYELARDVRYQAIKTVSGSLGRATRLTPEYLAAQFIDRSFNASFPATADGQPLCSAAHLIVGTNAATGTNALASASAMSQASAEEMRTQAMTQVGPDGLLTPVMVEKWLVPASLAVTAEKLSRTKQEIGSANNTVNTTYGTDYIVNPYLTSTTKWYGLTDQNEGLFWEWDQKAQFMEDNSITTLQKVYVAFMRMRWGCDDWRCIMGSNAV